MDVQEPLPKCVGEAVALSVPAEGRKCVEDHFGTHDAVKVLPVPALEWFRTGVVSRAGPRTGRVEYGSATCRDVLVGQHVHHRGCVLPGVNLLCQTLQSLRRVRVAHHASELVVRNASGISSER
eukprot:scaffold590_cov75-Phaeocystis_antarctica.AAC.3